MAESYLVTKNCGTTIEELKEAYKLKHMKNRVTEVSQDNNNTTLISWVGGGKATAHELKDTQNYAKQLYSKNKARDRLLAKLTQRNGQVLVDKIQVKHKQLK